MADLDVDPGQALLQPDKIRGDAPGLQAVLQSLSGEPGHKAQGRGVHAQAVEDRGDVDALAAEVHVLPAGAVQAPGPEAVHQDLIVQGGVQRYRIDHAHTSLTSV